MKLRNILLVLFSFPLLVNAQYRIEVKVEGITDSIAYIGHHFADQRYLKDTARISEDVAIFEGDTDLELGVYFFYSANSYFEFVTGDQKFSLQTKGPGFTANLVVTGSRENEAFSSFQKLSINDQDTFTKLSQQLQGATTEEEKQEIRKAMNDLSKGVLQKRIELGKKYPDTYAARLIKTMQDPEIPEIEDEMERYNHFVDHYFDNIDLTDDALLRSPLLHSRINNFLDNVVIQHPDSIINALEMILKKTKENPVVFRYALVTFSQKYEASNMMGMDKVFVHIADNYYLKGLATWADEELILKIRERVSAIRPNLIGNTAPELNLIDTLYTEYSLSDITSKYTVLYFYDPECGHCRTKTPILYSAYDSLRNLNVSVEVLAVNVATDIPRWKEYVKENEFQWINLADPYHRSNFRYLYDISSTPTIYVLDDEKKIIAKKIQAEDVAGFIDFVEKQGQ